MRRDPPTKVPWEHRKLFPNNNMMMMNNSELS